MAITSIKTGSSFTNLIKYDNFLGPNPAYNPSSYESIATVTVGAGGSSTVSFTSIPSTYTHLQIRTSMQSSLSSYGLMRFNSDSGSNYTSHFLYGDGSTATATALTSQSSIYALRGSPSTNYYAGTVIDILDYRNTNKYKTTRSLAGNDENGSGYVFFLSGLWLNTNAITDITIITQSGTFAQYSSFALYGIK